MARLEDIVQRIVVEGTGEAGSSFQEIAAAGKDAFDKISKAAEGGATGFKLFSTGALAVGAAIGVMVYEIGKFIVAEQEAILRLDALGKASNQSAGEIKGLEHALDSAGASAESVTRFISNAYRGVSESFSRIARQAEESAVTQRQADQTVIGSKLAVESALVKAQFSSADFKNKMTSDALAVAQAFNKIKFASEDMASQTNNDFLSVQGAALGVRAAQQALDEAMGYKVDDRDKQQLKVDQAAQNLYQAQQREQDAQLQANKNLAQQPLTRQQNALDLSNAQNQQAKDALQGPIDTARAMKEVDDARLQLEKDILAVAENRRQDSGTILSGLQNGVADPRAQVDKIVDAIREEASRRGGGTVEGTNKELIPLLADFFKNAKQAQAEGQQNALSRSTEEAIVQQIGRFSSRGGQSLDTSKIVDELEKGGENIRATTEKFKDSISTDAVQNAKVFTAGVNTFETAVHDFTQSVSIIATAVATGGNLKGYTPPSIDTAPPPFAGGGQVFGPGTGTSDSIHARLSHGEYVINAQAVRQYGTGLFHALNSMTMPGFAGGGFVSPSMAPIMRFADGGPVGGPHSIINLSIDGQRFDGLRAQQGVAQSLSRFAVNRQAASAGRKPSWMR